MQVTIYHNPRCSKSRQTLALLAERGIEPTVVNYLEDPPDEMTLRSLVAKLGIEPKELLRRKEAAFTELGLGEKLDDADAVIAAMAKAPSLIERPIVVVGARARLGRPPENVLELID